MVRPVPPDPSLQDNASNESDFVENESRDQNNAHDEDHRLQEASLQERLGPGFSLRHPISQTDTDYTPDNTNDGSSLYHGFLTDQFRRRNLPEPSNILPQEGAYHRVQHPTSSELIQAGAQIRLLSDEFAQSPMRQWVEEQAAAVPLETLDFNAFSELLFGLFQEGGVTWERVVVLFYFCADLAVRAFREKLPRQFHNIVEWSFRFFSGEQMMRWVAEHGGWAKVVQKSVDNVYKMIRIGFFVMGILAFAAYLWKSR